MPRDIAHDEAVLRRVNEAIERGLWPGEDEKPVRMRCECGRLGCNAFLEIRTGDYQRLRLHPRWFLLCAGHDTPAIEQVIARHPGYIVVEKTGDAARAAERSALGPECV